MQQKNNTGKKSTEKTLISQCLESCFVTLKDCAFLQQGRALLPVSIHFIEFVIGKKGNILQPAFNLPLSPQKEPENDDEEPLDDYHDL